MSLLRDSILFLQVLAIIGQLVRLDLHRAGVFFQAVAGKHLHVDHGALGAGGHAQEVSFTSEAFSPKIARSSFSSGVS